MKKFVVNSLKAIWDGIKALITNIVVKTIVVYKCTDWKLKILFGVLAVSAAINFPSMTALAASTLFDCGETHPLISLLVMFGVYFILFNIASIASEILIPLIFIVFLDWTLWVEHEYVGVNNEYKTGCTSNT